MRKTCIKEDEKGFQSSDQVKGPNSKTNKRQFLMENQYKRW